MADLLSVYRKKVKRIPQGADLYWHRMIGLIIDKKQNKNFFLNLADNVVKRQCIYEAYSDKELREKCRILQPVFQMGRETEEIILDALAVVREASRRIRREHPYPEQIAASLALLSGRVVELATGEGKTLSVALAAILEGWKRKGCHVVTVNDYLARRDAETMFELYRFCGVNAAYIIEDTQNEKRRRAYQADVLYATNKTLAADFLRDIVAKEKNGFVGIAERQLSSIPEITDESCLMRSLNSAFVDEADSVLIDESITPLILSGSGRKTENDQVFHIVKEVADSLTLQRDYQISKKERDAVLTEHGQKVLASFTCSYDQLFHNHPRFCELVIQSLVAKHFYKRGKQYVIHDQKVIIVDEFTGRLMPDREWRDGLHQAVSARENVEVTAPKETLARISYQRFFRMYSKLGGVTGTAQSAQREFWDVYTLPVVNIPTHKPCIRKYKSPIVFGSDSAKKKGVITAIKKANQIGMPILIGTRSVHDSYQLSDILKNERFFHEVLNAERHKDEADIVSKAGAYGMITVATNMAGRGTDIKLESSVFDTGGLMVILTERHENRRIDFQLFGRCSRQGDPGVALEIISTQDEVFRKYFGLFSNYLKIYGELKGIKRFICLRLFSMAQWADERRARIIRNQMAIQDEALCDALGFAGREFC